MMLLCRAIQASDDSAVFDDDWTRNMSRTYTEYLIETNL
jgi:hypothetical protein